MFSTQRTARGAALVASATLGLGGALAPATLAPGTFASAAYAQTQQPPKPELPIAVAADVVQHNISLVLLAQTGDYTLLQIGGVNSLDQVKVRLSAISVEDGIVATMTVPAAQMTASKNEEGNIELSIHQRLNVEQPYMVEIENLSNGETVSVEFMPEYGVTVGEIMASRQNIFFPDTPGVPRAAKVDANPTPEVSASPSASPSAAKDSPRPTAAPAPSAAPSKSTSASSSAHASASASASASANPSKAASDDAAPAEVTEDRLLVHNRPDGRAPAGTRETTLEISTAELRGSAEFQPISVSARNVAESGLGYDVMVFEMPANGGAVGSPLATTHVSPQQVAHGTFSADLQVPGAALNPGKRYRVVVVGGDSAEELQLMATTAFGVSVIQRAVPVDSAPKPAESSARPVGPVISDVNRRVSSSAPSASSLAAEPAVGSANLATDSVDKIPTVESALGYIAQAQRSARAITAQARSSVADTSAQTPATMVMAGYATLLPGRTVVNLLGYQSSESETVTVASPQENVGAAGSGSFYTRSSKSRGDSSGSKLEASAQDSGPLPEGTLPLSIALLGSVAFVGTAVAVNVYRRRLEDAEELGAE